MPNTVSWPYQDEIDPEDPEFEAQVRSMIGPPFEDMVDKSKAEHRGLSPVFRDSSLNLRGFRAPDNQSPKNIAWFEQNVAPYLVNKNPPKAGNVYALGPENQKVVWSHEFRHGKVGDEMNNRLMDAYFANSPKAWDNAVESWGEFHVLQGAKEAPSWDEAEKDLAEVLDHNWVKSLAQTHGTFKDRMTEFGGLFSDKLKTRANAAEFARSPWKLWANREEKE